MLLRVGVLDLHVTACIEINVQEGIETRSLFFCRIINF